MKMTLIPRFFIVTMVILASCRKETPGTLSSSSITVVNTIETANELAVYFSDTALAYYIDQAPVPYASSLEYGIPSATTSVLAISSFDTAMVMATTLALKPGGIYSLYFAGSGLPQVPVDVVFSQDTIPVYSDSAAGVRFISLSPGSGPVTVNLQGNLPTQTEFPALAYKQISAFKGYPDTSGITSYTFEIRDQASGNLLSTFQWNFTLFKSNTLTICGSENPNSMTPINVFQINNF
jgi:hypothetical protein